MLSQLNLTKSRSYIVIVLLHSDNPRDIVECDGAQTKVCVVGNVADLLDKGVEVGSLHSVDSRDKIRGRKAVLVSRRTPALNM